MVKVFIGNSNPTSLSDQDIAVLMVGKRITPLYHWTSRSCEFVCRPSGERGVHVFVIRSCRLLGVSRNREAIDCVNVARVITLHAKKIVKRWLFSFAYLINSRMWKNSLKREPGLSIDMLGGGVLHWFPSPCSIIPCQSITCVIPCRSRLYLILISTWIELNWIGFGEKRDVEGGSSNTNNNLRGSL